MSLGPSRVPLLTMISHATRTGYAGRSPAPVQQATQMFSIGFDCLRCSAPYYSSKLLVLLSEVRIVI